MVRASDKIFIDSDAFVGLNYLADGLHKKAASISDLLSGAQAQLYTGTNVLSEVVTILSQKVSHSHAISFLNFVRSGSITILHPDSKLIFEAEGLFIGQKSKNVSYSDCISFALMKGRDIEIAFSFDRDFKKNGFKLISEVL